MPDTEDVALWYAAYRFVVTYWAEVDRNGGGDAHDFYLADALFAVGQNRFPGRDKIRAFYRERQRRGFTTTRHLVSNLQVVSMGEREVRLSGVLCLYRADGHPPFHGARAPMLVADIGAECVREPDGRWLYRSHILNPLFVGSDIPYSLSVDPDALTRSS